MKAVIQRVNQCSVSVDETNVGEIQQGLLVLLGVAREDTQKDADYLAKKIPNLRIFEDNDGKMNSSLLDVKGEMLVVSQFTLLGDCRKGRRPSFVKAANPEKADELYVYFVERAKEYVPVQTGKFQAHMLVSLINDGPVTIIMDSP